MVNNCKTHLKPIYIVLLAILLLRTNALTCTDSSTYSGTGCTTCSTSSTCTTCSAQYYLSSGACTACASGTYSASGATSCTACTTGCATCTASGLTNCGTCSGGYSLSSTTCTQCTANTYSAGGTASSCTACATGSTSSAGATSCTTYGVAPVSSSNSGSFASSVLNSTAVKILSGSNSTDSTTDLWDSSSTTTVVAGVLASLTYFVPGTSNSTSYLLGALSSGYSSTGTGTYGAAATTATQTSYSSWRKRTINNTNVATGSDSTEASVIGDTAVSTTILANTFTSAVAPGYLGLLTTSVDGTSGTVNNQVYFYLVTASTGAAAQTKLTSTSDVVAATTSTLSCTITTFTLGNVFFDIGSNAFFFTYAKKVITTTAASGAGACLTTTLSTANTIYLGGIYLNGSVFWTSPISASTATAANSPSNIFAGNDNWLSSSNIYIIYKDATSGVLTTYYSKTSKSTSTTAIASFSTLIKDSTTGTSSTSTYVGLTYTPVSVWASNYTYGITLQLQTASGATPTYAYTYTNFINGSTTGVDSGLSNSGASLSTDAGSYYGYQLNTGYSVIAYWQTGTSTPYSNSYTLATYYANGTVNKTAATLGSTTYVTPQFYEDANGTFWIGWLDIDTANTGKGYLTYNAYLGILQGQLNSPSSAGIVLRAIYAFILLFVAIFAL